jgi:HK97 family phage prohead protease
MSDEERTDEVQVDEHPPLLQRATFSAEVKAVNVKKREVLHKITSMEVDRAGDVVMPAGAIVDDYLRHPVVMADHAYGLEKVIGKNVSLEIDGEAIWARTQYRNTTLGNEALALVKEGLGAWSIGFSPVEYEPITEGKRGFKYKKWKLLEYSQVALPMNQDIVSNAVKRGLVSEEHVPVFFRVTKDESDESKPTHEPEATTTPEAGSEQEKVQSGGGISSEAYSAILDVGRMAERYGATVGETNRARKRDSNGQG